MGLEGRTLDMGSANRSFTTDYSLTFGCLELPSYLADEGPQCSPFTCYVKGGCQRERQGQPQAADKKDLPHGTFRWASTLGSSAWQCFHDNHSHLEAGNNALLNFMTQ